MPRFDTRPEKYADLPSTESLVAGAAAARCGSFSEAASALGISQATLSRRVAALEAWAGAKLFDRHARGTSLTQDGQRMVARVDAALMELAVLGRPRRVVHSRPIVRVAVTPSFARFWLFSRILALEAGPPWLRIEIIPSLQNLSLRNGEADLAVRYGRGNWEGEECSTRLLSDVLVPVVAQEDANASITPIAIASRPLLHDGDTTNWQAWCRIHGVDWRPKAQDRILPDHALATDAARMDLGVALWNISFGMPPEGLVMLQPFQMTGSMGHYLLARPHDMQSPASELAKRLLALRGPIDLDS